MFFLMTEKTQLLLKNKSNMLLHYFFVLRSKSGIWGWRSDRTEVVNGFEAQVRTWPAVCELRYRSESLEGQKTVTESVTLFL